MCMHEYMFVCTYLYMFVRTYVYMYICIFVMSFRVCVDMVIYMFTFSCILVSTSVDVMIEICYC